MFKFCCLLLMALILTGCASALPTATLTMQPTVSVPLSSTPTPAPPTPTPSATRPPTSRPIPTALPPTVTPTPFVSFGHPLPPSEVVISAGNAQISLQARWGRGILNRVLYSPDGRYLALATTIGIYVYDAVTLKELGLFETAGVAQKTVFSPDGRYLALATETLVQVWQVDAGVLLYTLDGQSFNEPTFPRDLAFSSDSQVLAFTWRSGVHLHRADDGAPINTLPVPQGTLSTVFFASGGEMLLISSDGKKLWVWRAGACMIDPAQSENCLVRQQALTGETNWMPTKAFSPDGSLLVTIASNGAMWVWRLSDGHKIQHLSGQGTITFSPDGRLLAYGSINGPTGGILRLWRVEDGELVFESSDFEGSVASVSFSPDGATLATASRDGLVRLWHTDDWSLGEMVGWFPYQPVTSLALSPDESILAVASDHYIRLWSVPDGGYLSRLEKHIGVNSLAFSPDGTLLASGGATGLINVWQMPDGALRYALRDTKHAVYSVSFSPDGALLAAGGTKGQVFFWNVATGSLVRALEGYVGDTYSLAFSPDASLLATGHEYGRLQIWQVASGELLRTLELDGADIGDVAFAPNGELLAVAAGSNRAWLWQSSDWTPRRILTEHTGNVLRLAFSPDGALLATATDDNRLWLWRVADGALLNDCYAHTEEIADLVFAPGGDLIISGSQDGSARFWGLDSSTVAPEPTTTPAPAPTSPPAGAFYQVAGLPFSEINHLWVAPDGQLWLAAGSGLFVNQDKEWKQVYEGMANRILGLDAEQRLWVLLDEGWRIGAYSEPSWSIYGSEQGWSQGSARQVLSDRRGWVWINTGQDLRYFDPASSSWTTLSLSDVGFEPPEDPDQVFEITDMALDSAGNLWVGGCGNWGLSFLAQGARWFDGQTWSSSQDTADECVNGIEVDTAGRVWLGGFYGLIMYNPASQSWAEFPLPGWDRPQLVDNVALDTQGRPWVSFTRFGGAGPWHSNAIFYLEDGQWQAAFDPGIDMPISFSFGPDGAVWVLAGGDVYRPTAGEPEPIGPPDHGEQLVIDGAGRVWVLGAYEGLWRLDSASE